MRDVDWLIAPDSFKGTFAAREVARAIAAGAAIADEDAAFDLCPVADGVHVLAGSIALDAHQAEPLELASMRQTGDLAELASAGRTLAASACSV